MARRKIILHGSLKKLAPEGLELEADTVMEAVNGMARMLNIKPNAITGKLTVKVVGFETLDSLMLPSTQEELHIVPNLSGSGIFDFVKIVVGAVLIAVALIVPMDPLTKAFLINLGATLIIGGVINLLFPVKQADTDQNYLGAPGNTTAIGTRISLIFGEVQVYGQILSYNIDSVITDPIVQR